MEPKLEILPESQRNLWPQLGLIPDNEILNLSLFTNSNLVSRTPGSITLTVDSPAPVKFQFFGALPLSRVKKPALLNPPGILIASPYDLFATKLKVIQDRADKKDYLDIIEFLNQGYDFAYGLAAAVAVYRNKFNPQITLRAAVSFIDGDLPSLSREDRQVMEKAVANFWRLKSVLSETTAESSDLATI